MIRTGVSGTDQGYGSIPDEPLQKRRKNNLDKLIARAVAIVGEAADRFIDELRSGVKTPVERFRFRLEKIDGQSLSAAAVPTIAQAISEQLGFGTVVYQYPSYSIVAAEKDGA